MAIITSFQISSTYLLSQLFPLGFQALAVTTPGGVELNQHVLVLLVHNGVKVLSYHSLEDDKGWKGLALVRMVYTDKP